MKSRRRELCPCLGTRAVVCVIIPIISQLQLPVQRTRYPRHTPRHLTFVMRSHILSYRTNQRAWPGWIGWWDCTIYPDIAPEYSACPDLQLLYKPRCHSVLSQPRVTRSCGADNHARHSLQLPNAWTFLANIHYQKIAYFCIKSLP